MSKKQIKTTIDYLRSWKTAYLMSDEEESIIRIKNNEGHGIEDLLSGIHSEEPSTKCLATYLFDQLTESEKREVERIMREKYNTDLDIEQQTAIYYDFKGVYK